jgi:hypothetical protein
VETCCCGLSCITRCSNVQVCRDGHVCLGVCISIIVLQRVITILHFNFTVAAPAPSSACRPIHSPDNPWLHGPVSLVPYSGPFLFPVHVPRMDMLTSKAPIIPIAYEVTCQSTALSITRRPDLAAPIASGQGAPEAQFCCTAFAKIRPYPRRVHDLSIQSERYRSQPRSAG